MSVDFSDPGKVTVLVILGVAFAGFGYIGYEHLSRPGPSNLERTDGSQNERTSSIGWNQRRESSDDVDNPAFNFNFNPNDRPDRLSSGGGSKRRRNKKTKKTKRRNK